MISIVIVSYRTGDVLWRSLESALAQDGVSDVILVDNGNPDDVRARLRLMEEGEPRFAVLSGHGNIGFAAACNLGAQEAAGSAFLFLNPDAILPPGAALELLRIGALQDREHWATGPRLLDPDGTEQRGSRRAILTPWNAFVEATRLYRLAPRHPAFRRFNEHEGPTPDRPTPVPCLSGACFLVPRGTWQALGGMDRRFFLHVEDVDFFLRLNRIGGTAVYVPGVGVVHHKSSSEVDPLEVERRKKQSMNLYFATHFKGIYPPGFLTVLRAMLWVSFGFRSVKFRLRRFVG